MTSNGFIPKVLSTAVELLLSFISLLIYPRNSSCRPRLCSAAKNDSEKVMRYFGVFSQVDCMVPIRNTVIREKVVSEASTLKVYFYCVFFFENDLALAFV